MSEKSSGKKSTPPKEEKNVSIPAQKPSTGSIEVIREGPSTKDTPGGKRVTIKE